MSAPLYHTDRMNELKDAVYLLDCWGEYVEIYIVLELSIKEVRGSTMSSMVSD